MVLASAVMLAARSRPLCKVCYSPGVGAASQVPINPDLGMYTLPHFYFFQTAASHGLDVISAVYMTVVEKFRPHPKSLLGVAIGMNAYPLIIALVDRIPGRNYLFFSHKRGVPPLLNTLGSRQ